MYIGNSPRGRTGSAAGTLVGRSSAMENQGKNGFVLFFAVFFSGVTLFSFVFGSGREISESQLPCVLFDCDGSLLEEMGGNSYDSEENLNGSGPSDHRLLWRCGCLVSAPFEFHLSPDSGCVCGRVPHFHVQKIRETNQQRDGPFSV